MQLAAWNQVDAAGAGERAPLAVLLAQQWDQRRCRGKDDRLALVQHHKACVQVSWADAIGGSGG
jgi:hypothetical protein